MKALDRIVQRLEKSMEQNTDAREVYVKQFGTTGWQYNYSNGWDDALRHARAVIAEEEKGPDAGVEMVCYGRVTLLNGKEIPCEKKCRERATVLELEKFKCIAYQDQTGVKTSWVVD